MRCGEDGVRDDDSAFGILALRLGKFVGPIVTIARIICWIQQGGC
jgi:hypothetical protein